MVDDSGTLQLGALTVHRLGFGTMQLTGPGVWGPPRGPRRRHRASCVAPSSWAST